MAAYVLTEVPVIDALAAAALSRLAAAPNVEVRSKRRGAVMHRKAYLVDGRVVREGTANLSASGLKAQDNDRIETDDPAAVAAFRAAFEAMWAR